MADDTGFLSRWSRRKAEVRSGALPTAPVPEPLAVVVAPPAPAVEPQPGPAAPPAPTMDDVAQLTHDADFSRFMAPAVDGDVKNAALKKLFTDPHFNVMDGLDTYIDDYGKPDPIPESMLRQMVQSKLLGLFDHEEEEKKPEQPEAPAAPVAAAPEPTATLPEPAPDENLDLRLQPDDDAGRAGLEPRPGEDAGRQH